MEIHNLRPSGAGNAVARFDVEVARGIVLRDWRLRRTSNGLRVFPPTTEGDRGNVTLSPEVIAEIRRVATDKFEGVVLHATQ